MMMMMMMIIIITIIITEIKIFSPSDSILSLALFAGVSESQSGTF